MKRFLRGVRVGVGLGLAAMLVTVVGALPATANPTNTGLVISQVYGGGGNSGAQYTNDFVEIFNPKPGAQSLSGMSVQYASADGTGNFASNPVTALSGSLASGQYYLVQLAGGSTGVALPTPDATGTVNMSGTSGKVILANVTTGVACNGGSTPCALSDLAQIVDLVGYGTANFFEGAAGPALTNTTAAFRASGGCTDTDSNAAEHGLAADCVRRAPAGHANEHADRDPDSHSDRHTRCPRRKLF